MKTFAALAAAALTLGLSTAPALAAGHSWQVGNSSFHVYFDGLDLQAPAGRAAALARVETAAARLCGGVGVRTEVRACERKIVADAAQGSAHGALQLALAERDGADIRLAQAK